MQLYLRNGSLASKRTLTSSLHLLLLTLTHLYDRFGRQNFAAHEPQYIASLNLTFNHFTVERRRHVVGRIWPSGSRRPSWGGSSGPRVELSSSILSRTLPPSLLSLSIAIPAFPREVPLLLFLVGPSPPRETIQLRRGDLWSLFQSRPRKDLCLLRVPRHKRKLYAVSKANFGCLSLFLSLKVSPTMSSC